MQVIKKQLQYKFNNYHKIKDNVMSVILAILAVSLIIGVITYSRKKIENGSLRFVIITIAAIAIVAGAAYLGGQLGGIEGFSDTIVYMIYVAIGFAILKAIFFRKLKEKDAVVHNLK